MDNIFPGYLITIYYNSHYALYFRFRQIVPKYRIMGSVILNIKIAMCVALSC